MNFELHHARNFLSRRRVALVGAGLVALTFLFRLPALLNPDALDSDVAIVGLQAKHLFEGPNPLLLWGTSYQGITGPLAAWLFRALPVRPSLSLALSAVTGHALLVLALFGITRRAAGLWVGALLAALLIAVPEPLNYLTFSGFRTWAFTFAFVALYFGERAVDAEPLRLFGLFAALAGMAAGLAYYSDLFVIQLLPGLAVWAVGCVVAAGTWRRRGVGVLLGVGGWLVGSIPRFASEMKGAGLGEVSLDNIRRMWPLFSEQCFPYALGWKLFPALVPFHRPEWQRSWPTLAISFAGLAVAALLYFAAGALIVVPAAADRRRRLAWCGLGWMGTSIAGFLLTRRGVDIMSARYLVPVVLGLPLVAATVFTLPSVRRSKIALPVLGIVLLHFAITGWVGYGAWMKDGAIPILTPYGTGRDESALLQALQSRGVRVGIADYWVSYRLTLLWDEAVVVVPFGGDRYGPYRARLREPGPVAYVFLHIQDHAANALRWAEASVRAQGRTVERLDVGQYTALIAR